MWCPSAELNDKAYQVACGLACSGLRGGDVPAARMLLLSQTAILDMAAHLGVVPVRPDNTTVTGTWLDERRSKLG